MRERERERRHVPLPSSPCVGDKPRCADQCPGFHSKGQIIWSSGAATYALQKPVQHWPASRCRASMMKPYCSIKASCPSPQNLDLRISTFSETRTSWAETRTPWSTPARTAARCLKLKARSTWTEKGISVRVHRPIGCPLAFAILGVWFGLRFGWGMVG